MDKRTLNVVLGLVAREARQKAHKSLKQVGDAIGCNRQNVSHLELGEQSWSVHRLVMYARAVHLPPSALLRSALQRRRANPKPVPVSHEEEHQGTAADRAP